MKVLGIGVDIIDNRRIAELLQKSIQKRFLTRVLHQEEVLFYHQEQERLQSAQLTESEDHRLATYVASRWASKEALVKCANYKDLVFS